MGPSERAALERQANGVRTQFSRVVSDEGASLDPQAS